MAVSLLLWFQHEESGTKTGQVGAGAHAYGSRHSACIRAFLPDCDADKPDVAGHGRTCGHCTIAALDTRKKETHLDTLLLDSDKSLRE